MEEQMLTLEKFEEASEVVKKVLARPSLFIVIILAHRLEIRCI